MGSTIEKNTPYEIFKINIINVGLSDYPCLQGKADFDLVK